MKIGIFNTWIHAVKAAISVTEITQDVKNPILISRINWAPADWRQNQVLKKEILLPTE